MSVRIFTHAGRLSEDGGPPTAADRGPPKQVVGNPLRPTTDEKVTMAMELDGRE